MAGPEQLRVLDACVLIDFCMEDPSLLGLAAEHLGSIIVLSPILAEVSQLDDVEVERLGLIVVEPEIALAIEATARRGGLSYRDRLCLLFCRDNKATLCTNDKALLRAAQSDGIEACWGVEILLDLVAVGLLTPSDATNTAQSICNRSRFPSDAPMAELERRLRRL